MRKEPQLMPRLYGPGHFTEDPYSQVVSPHGIPVDDLVAVLQIHRRDEAENGTVPRPSRWASATAAPDCD